MKDNLLSDIESDLDKDWGQLEEEKTAKEIAAAEEEIKDYIKNNPQRLNISYRDFHETLFRIFDSRDADIAMYDLQVLLRRIFSNHRDDPLPKGFEEIWNMFCNPREYKCISDVRCESCNNSYDIISQFQQPQRYEYETYSQFIYGNQHIENEGILCPTCSHSLLNLHGYKLIGIFKHKQNDSLEEMEMEIERIKMQYYGMSMRNDSIAESYGF